MIQNKRTNLGQVVQLLATIVFGFSPLLKSDVVVLQSGAVITGTILQQDASGVLLQTGSGTYRYPPAWLKEVRKEVAVAPAGAGGMV